MQINTTMRRYGDGLRRLKIDEGSPQRGAVSPTPGRGFGKNQSSR